ncbi:hypothetical protein GGI20_001720 [Coemansia sp. BCRC 34301]|nr:hypothetical protein GGI20_001720 [Coemansia sp. BCRC 34301]
MAWVRKASSALRMCTNLSPIEQCHLVANRLPSKVAKQVKVAEFEAADRLLQALVANFPVDDFKKKLITRLRRGYVFKISGRKNLISDARRMLEDLGDLPGGLCAMADALSRVSPELWALTGVSAAHATYEDVENSLVIFARFVQDKKVALNLDPSNTQATKRSAANPENPAKETAPQPTSKSAVKLGKPQRRSRARCREKLDQAKAKSEKYKAHEAAAVAALAKAQSAPSSALSVRQQQQQENCSHRLYPRFAGSQSWLRSTRGGDGQSASTHVWLEGLQVGEATIRAAVNPVQASVSIITLDAADELGLAVDTNWRPHLLPAWIRAPHLALGCAEVSVNFADGPKRRTRVVVVDQQQPWELLIGTKLLDALDVELVMQAKRECRPNDVKSPGFCDKAPRLVAKEGKCAGDVKAATEEAVSCGSYAVDTVAGIESRANVGEPEQDHDSANDMGLCSIFYDQLNSLLKSLSASVQAEAAMAELPPAESRAMFLAIEDPCPAYCDGSDTTSAAPPGYSNRHTVAEKANAAEATIIASVPSSPLVESGLVLQNRPAKRHTREWDETEACGTATVRVTGTLHSYSPKTDRASLVDGQSLLLVDTRLLGVHQYHIGQTYQLIGVVAASAHGDGEEPPKDLLEEDVRFSLDIVLQARVVREVDGLDMVVYRKSVVMLRAFLGETVKKHEPASPA